MDLESIWAQVEQEQAWRTDEIRFFDNHAATLSDENQSRFRRANILLLYSHYEGFCKFMFNLYVTTINAAGLRSRDVNFALAAASLDQVFRELRNPQGKAVEFRGIMPEDTKLQVFARDKAFLEKSSDFENRPLMIPDTVVDTESNLKPIVLRKNLFRLGFPHDALQSVEGHIHRLLLIRNEIAHGASSRVIPFSEYEELRQAAFKVMDEVKRFVISYLQSSNYLRRA